ncbi:MAG: SDR family oxidoreductase [Chloroflexota bacterium]|nr:SDR family oxidoreductase [Chloroflexota bacterium]
MPSFSLQNKVVLVTGGSRGIGKAIALGFAEAGADVVICSRKAPDLEAVAEEIRGLGRKSLAVPTNITVKEEVDNLVNKTLEEFEHIDILVNNAAMNILSPLLDLREDGWDKIMNTDLKGYYLCSQAVGKVMVGRGGGNIINIASTAAVKSAPGMGAYCIAKAGVIMLTQVLSTELVPSKVRVNAIAPSMVKTRFSQPLWNVPEVESMITAQIPLGRLAEPEEMVGAALFLASDASSYITGQTLFLDGGSLA